MNEIEKIKIWENIKTEIAKIHDQKTRSIYYRGLLARAMNTWGFNPEKPTHGQKNSVIVDDWEKEYLEDLQESISYGLDTREEKRKKTLDETRKNMRNFVRAGNKLEDIPKEIRTKHICNLYFEELFKIGSDLAQCVDDLMEN